MYSRARDVGRQAALDNAGSQADGTNHGRRGLAGSMVEPRQPVEPSEDVAHLAAGTALPIPAPEVLMRSNRVPLVAVAGTSGLPRAGCLARSARNAETQARAQTRSVDRAGPVRRVGPVARYRLPSPPHRCFVLRRSGWLSRGPTGRRRVRDLHR